MAFFKSPAERVFGATYRDGFRYKLFKNKWEIGWRFYWLWFMCDAFKGVIFRALQS